MERQQQLQQQVCGLQQAKISDSEPEVLSSVVEEPKEGDHATSSLCSPSGSYMGEADGAVLQRSGSCSSGGSSQDLGPPNLLVRKPLPTQGEALQGDLRRLQNQVMRTQAATWYGFAEPSSSSSGSAEPSSSSSHKACVQQMTSGLTGIAMSTESWNAEVEEVVVETLCSSSTQRDSMLQCAPLQEYSQRHSQNGPAEVRSVSCNERFLDVLPEEEGSGTTPSSLSTANLQDLQQAEDNWTKTKPPVVAFRNDFLSQDLQQAEDTWTKTKPPVPAFRNDFLSQDYAIPSGVVRSVGSINMPATTQEHQQFDAPSQSQYCSTKVSSTTRTSLNPVDSAKVPEVVVWKPKLTASDGVAVSESKDSKIVGSCQSSFRPVVAQIRTCETLSPSLNAATPRATAPAWTELSRDVSCGGSASIVQAPQTSEVIVATSSNENSVTRSIAVHARKLNDHEVATSTRQTSIPLNSCWVPTVICHEPASVNRKPSSERQSYRMQHANAKTRQFSPQQNTTNMRQSLVQGRSTSPAQSQSVIRQAGTSSTSEARPVFLQASTDVKVSPKLDNRQQRPGSPTGWRPVQQTSSELKTSQQAEIKYTRTSPLKTDRVASGAMTSAWQMLNQAEQFPVVESSSRFQISSLHSPRQASSSASEAGLRIRNVEKVAAVLPEPVILGGAISPPVPFAGQSPRFASCWPALPCHTSSVYQTSLNSQPLRQCTLSPTRTRSSIP